MCGRFTLINWEEVVLRFGIRVEGLLPRYNIAPTQQVPVIINEHGPCIRLSRWGLIPFWAKDMAIGNKLINARAETINEKVSFRQSLKSRRCLVPADGFYEWQKSVGKKKPYHFSLQDGGLFAFAGLWDVWHTPSGEDVCSFTIITTEANSLVASVHNRMPVILSKEAEESWLTSSGPDVSPLRELLVPYPAEEMVAREASPLVNSAAHDTPDVFKLPGLFI